jgi:hypothetical protein
MTRHAINRIHQRCEVSPLVKARLKMLVLFQLFTLLVKNLGWIHISGGARLGISDANIKDAPPPMLPKPIYCNVTSILVVRRFSLIDRVF